MQADEFSDEGGSPGGRNKRVQANRLSAQRSRQRKLEREAQLMGDVDKLGREIAKLHHEEGALIQQEAGEISVSLHLSYQTTQGASSATNLLCWAARSPSSTTRRAPSSSRRLVRGHTFPCQLALHVRHLNKPVVGEFAESCIARAPSSSRRPVRGRWCFFGVLHGRLH